MEHTLRCNAMKCRKELNEHAVVTTCRYVRCTPGGIHILLIIYSHVFCIDCANRLKLSDPPNGQRPVCPACDTHLVNPDDAVITNLKPTEDYKTSVLSGLSPTIIMECAGRALSFWAYQATQEVYDFLTFYYDTADNTERVYQEIMVTSLSDKHNSLNAQMDKIIHDANAEISDLRIKMNSMDFEITL